MRAAQTTDATQAHDFDLRRIIGGDVMLVNCCNSPAMSFCVAAIFDNERIANVSLHAQDKASPYTNASLTAMCSAHQAGMETVRKKCVIAWAYVCKSSRSLSFQLSNRFFFIYGVADSA